MFCNRPRGIYLSVFQIGSPGAKRQIGRCLITTSYLLLFLLRHGFHIIKLSIYSCSASISYERKRENGKEENKIKDRWMTDHPLLVLRQAAPWIDSVLDHGGIILARDEEKERKTD